MRPIGRVRDVVRFVVGGWIYPGPHLGRAVPTTEAAAARSGAWRGGVLVDTSLILRFRSVFLANGLCFWI